jgi:hypothetical protein
MKDTRRNRRAYGYHGGGGRFKWALAAALGRSAVLRSRELDCNRKGDNSNKNSASVAPSYHNFGRAVDRRYSRSRGRGSYLQLIEVTTARRVRTSLLPQPENFESCKPKFSGGFKNPPEQGIPEIFCVRESPTADPSAPLGMTSGEWCSPKTAELYREFVCVMTPQPFM